MVRRTSDCRLLVALLGAEQTYSKALIHLLSDSQSSLASFSAYASSCAPPTSYAILAVATSLAGADEALSRYAHAVDTWRNELESLKKLEQDVADVIRDREILITRLLKASKSTKPTRDSFIFPSSSSIPSHSSLSLISTATKLGNAQAELQACEAHLAALEQDVEQRRIEVVKEGLGVRLRALVECGWAWGEMGKEGLRALEDLGSKETQSTAFQPQLTPPSSISHSHSSPSKHVSVIPRDPRPHPPSDTSLSPSQSASNICLPAAHKIHDFIVPTSDHSHAPPLPPTLPSKPSLTHRISELTEPPSDHELNNDGENSSVEDTHGEYRIVENERFAALGGTTASQGQGKLKARTRKFSIRSSPAKSEISPFPKERERKQSTSNFFGSIRGLFKGKVKGNEHDSDDERTYRTNPDSAPSTPLKGGRLYSSEIGARFAGVGAGDADHSGAESDPGGAGPSRARRKVHKKSRSDLGASASTARSGKGKMVEEWVGKQSREHLLEPPLTRKPRSAASKRDASDVELQTKLNTHINGGGLSRNSSVRSTHPIPHTPSPKSERTSVRSSPTPKHGRSAREGGSMSLMSIVEGIGRSGGPTESYLPSIYQASTNGVPGLVVPKAPPRITRADIDGLPTVRGEEEGSGRLSSVLDVSRVPGGVLSADATTLSDSGVRQEATEGHVRAAEPSSSTSLSPQAHVGPNGASAGRPAKTPLRSALRSSRSPSPMARMAAGPEVSAVPANEKGKGKAPAPPEDGPPVQNGTIEDDAASISSYETGHETLMPDDEDQGPVPGPSTSSATTAGGPPPPPPVVIAVQSDGEMMREEPDRPVDETSSSSPPARRKSVRVSLKPQFSPTPPALEDNGEGEEEEVVLMEGTRWDHQGKSVGDHGARRHVEEETEGAWEDSSEEDEEYARARRLLGRVARRAKMPL